MKMNQQTSPVADYTQSVALFEALGIKLIVSAREKHEYLMA